MVAGTNRLATQILYYRVTEGDIGAWICLPTNSCSGLFEPLAGFHGERSGRGLSVRAPGGEWVGLG